MKKKKTVFPLIMFCFLCIAIFITISLTSYIINYNNNISENDSLALSIPTSAAQQIEQTMLANIKQHGFNGYSGAQGGLWVNWKYGTNPLQTNFNGTGQTDQQSNAAFRHDPLTDIRYLHNLWLYKKQNPNDTTYDSEVTRYTPIVKTEFQGTTDQRGWLMDEEFLDIYTLSHDTWFKDTALGMAAGYAKQIDPSVGIMYKKDTISTLGHYRSEDDVEAACALIMAGTIANNTAYTQLGKTALNFLYTHAYIPQYHTFPDQLDQVLTSSGGVNPDEVFYKQPYRNYFIYGNFVRVGGIAQIILSLLDTYAVTNDPSYLQKAEDLAAPFSLPLNTFGIWDTTNLGYEKDVNFDGIGPHSPGNFKIDIGGKEAGRQISMLWVYHLINTFDNNKYQNMENLLLTVAINKAYYAPGHGVIYEVADNWQPLTINGTLGDWVTTEAMGAELEALFIAVNPATIPTGNPSMQPSVFPSVLPTIFPSTMPTNSPSLLPTNKPSATPVISSSPFMTGLFFKGTVLSVSGNTFVLHDETYGNVYVTVASEARIRDDSGKDSLIKYFKPNDNVHLSGDYYPKTHTVINGNYVVDSNL